MNTKEQIINEYVVGGSSFRLLGKKHGIGTSTIHRWVFEHRGLNCRDNSSKEMVILPEMNKEPVEGLPTDMLELRRQLEQERLRNKLLTAMIDIAEDELKIPIRKKYGTKPLKK